MNKEVMLFFTGDLQGRKYFTTNKFHTKISNGELFPNYGNYFAVDTISSNLSDFTMHLHITGPGVTPAEQRTLEYLEEVAVATAQ